MQNLIQQIITKAIERNASDIHIAPGRPPMLRVTGELVSLDEHPVLTPQDTTDLAKALTDEEQFRRFSKERELDISISRPGSGRFRVNLYWQRGSIAIAMRIIPHDIQTLDELALPAPLKKFALADHGLFLVTGPTGSGKSTTLAAMIDYINSNRNGHIITIEDPIEHLHRHKKALVNQREMHDDTFSFNEALRHILRQDPNVVLIGEMRDLETIQTALIIAETGHLVLATLHTGDTSQAISRIIDVYPPHQMSQARTQLSMVLLGVMAQQLIRRKDGTSRVMAHELLVNTPAISHLIRSGEVHQIYSSVQTGTAEGMNTLNASLLGLYRQGLISRTDAMRKSTRQKELIDLMDQGGMR